MRDLASCPHCGSPMTTPASGTSTALDSLYREVRRIREIAEARHDAPALGAAAGSSHARSGARPRAWDEREARLRIEELTREVNELRATVARLRGSALAPVAG